MYCQYEFAIMFFKYEDEQGKAEQVSNEALWGEVNCQVWQNFSREQ